MEKTCKTCIYYPCLRIDCGKVCNQYKTEVQEILEGIDRILEEGYQDWERTKIGGNMLNKTIHRILDRYYADKLIKEIIDSFRCIYYLDFKIERSENRICLYVKKPKYKNTEYEKVIHFRIEEAIMHLIRIDNTRKAVREIIEEYLKKE